MNDFRQHLIDQDSSIREALKQLDKLSGYELVLFVLDGGQRLVGTLTDGDVRRSLIAGVLLDEKIASVMNSGFHFLDADHCSPSHVNALVRRNIFLAPYLSEDGRIVKVYNFRRTRTILPIDVVMMAGGKGVRLRPLTDHVPKPLLKVGGKAIIDYNVDSLLRCGVEKFHITVNYLAEQLEEHFAARDDAEYSCVREDMPLGTIGAVALIEDLGHDAVLVMNSDLFTNIDFADFYRSFAEEDADMTIASIPYNVDIPFAVLDLEGDCVKAFKEKPSFTYYANAGIYLIKRTCLDLIEKGCCYNATDLIQALIDGGRKVTKYPIVGYWVDIGRHEDYAKVQEFVKHIN